MRGKNMQDRDYSRDKLDADELRARRQIQACMIPLPDEDIEQESDEELTQAIERINGKSYDRSQ